MTNQDIGTKQYFTGRGLAVLTASDAMQYAFEGDEVKGEGVRSVFTRALVRGLQTGDADLNSDGRITFDELYEYVYDRVVNETPQQKPRKWTFDVQGEIVIAWNPHLATERLEEEPEEKPKSEDLEEGPEAGFFEIATRALADTPSEIDLLGFKDYAEALADFIVNEKTTKPLTIGIDAPWGMGKTTLMRMVRNRLVQQEAQSNRERSFPTVWFNAWKYDQEESLWAALALEILTQVRKQYNVFERARLWMELNWKRFDWGRLLRSVLKSLAYVFGIGLLGAAVLGVASLGLGADLQEVIQRLQQYAKIVGGVGVITALYAAGKEAYNRVAGPFDLNIAQYVREPHYKERIGFLAEFEEDFKRVIDVVTEEGKWPLIVFIDDLDRCAPPKPVEIIEAINILLDAKHCIFVIGMDAETVAGSIEAKYKDLKDYLDGADDAHGLTLGHRFLEKIIQINFRIPRPEPELVKSFVNASLDTLQARPTEDASREKVTEVEQLIKAEQRDGQSLDEAARAVQATRPDVVEEAKREVFAGSFDDSEEVRHAIQEATPYLGLNPRKVKRFINLFRLQALIANRRGLLGTEVIQLGLLSKWVAIQTCWPDMVEGMIADSGFIERLKEANRIKHELLKVGDSDQKQRIRAGLDSLLANPRIRRLAGASNLIELLEGISASDVENLPHYLCLAQVTASRSGPDLDARADTLTDSPESNA